MELLTEATIKKINELFYRKNSLEESIKRLTSTEHKGKLHICFTTTYNYQTRYSSLIALDPRMTQTIRGHIQFEIKEVETELLSLGVKV